MSTVSTAAADDVASLSNNKNTLSSAKPISKPSLPDIGDDSDPYDKDFAPPKCPTRRSVEPEIQEILLDQFGNEIVEDLPEVSQHATRLSYLINLVCSAIETSQRTQT